MPGSSAPAHLPQPPASAQQSLGGHQGAEATPRRQHARTSPLQTRGASASHACRLQCHPGSPRLWPLCRRAPRVRAAVWSLVAPARLLSRPMRAGCSVIPGRPSPSAFVPHACRLRCGPRSSRRWPLCRRTPHVQAAVSSPVAVSGQQCSREFLLAQPTSLVPRAWRGLLALNRAAGLGSRPPCRATLYQPGPWWRNGFGVRFSVSPTIVKLLVWIQTSRGLHLPTCWSQYLVSELTCEVCSQHSPHTRRRACLPQRTHLEGSEREGVAVSQMLVVEAWVVSLFP